MPFEYEVKVGYMCPIDYKYELENAAGGTKVYCSINDLKREHTCWEECGIVEVEVKVRKVVMEGTESV